MLILSLGSEQNIFAWGVSVVVQSAFRLVKGCVTKFCLYENRFIVLFENMIVKLRDKPLQSELLNV